MAKKSVLDWIALVLVIIGGLNWGLTALNYNVVDMLFSGSLAIVATIIYGLVGLAALYMIYFAIKK
ncbi:MAG: DUF378 domain-containing protein [Candidatus Pacearchaeota archaeon]|jgi:hypothetical protein